MGFGGGIGNYLLVKLLFGNGGTNRLGGAVPYMEVRKDWFCGGG